MKNNLKMLILTKDKFMKGPGHVPLNWRRYNKFIYVNFIKYKKVS